MKMGFLANVVKWLHVGSVVFILLGWMLPEPYRIPHLIFLFLVMLHWWTNKGQCVLTQIEKKLKGESATQVQGAFVKSLFAKLDLDPSPGQMMIVIYGLVAISGYLSVRTLF